ncbi:MAG: PSP1 domain-containing protein [Candidatus Poribacteria bacterium]
MEEIDVVRVKCNETGVYTYELSDQDLNIGDYCVVQGINNNDDQELGLIIARFKVYKCQNSKPIPKILRKATEEDKRHFEELKNKEKDAYAICLKKIKEHQLPMKLIKSHYSFDESKLTFYFTSDRRVDFRELVKDLAYIFKRRIELRQIGPKDEAQMLGGIGSCGQEICCTTFLRKPCNIPMKTAKEQNMTLTPSKISGICGRLLCCLKFESDWYQYIKKNMPQVGSKFELDGISGKVEEIDPFHGIIKVRDERSGKLIEIELDDF